MDGSHKSDFRNRPRVLIAKRQARPVSIARCYGRPVIDLGSISGLHAHSHQLAAYCCDVWRPLPLGKWVRQGKGSLRRPIRVRCRDCGEAGQLQVRLPMPARSSTGWIAPP